MHFSKELELAIRASIKAGEAIMNIYNSKNFEVELKGDNSPLTNADKVAHQIIRSFLKNDLPMLSEEGSNIPFTERKNWKRFWMVDPVDGTKEFIKRNGEFTVNIALIDNHKPILGVVFAPALKELYFADKGFGSYKAERVYCFDDILNTEIIDLSKTDYPEKYSIVVSRSHMNDKTQKFIDKKEEEYGSISIVSYGSSLKICKVADGSAHSYPRFGPTMEWDTAAAHAIALHANNKIFQDDGSSEIIYNKKNLLNPHFLVTK